MSVEYLRRQNIQVECYLDVSILAFSLVDSLVLLALVVHPNPMRDVVTAIKGMTHQFCIRTESQDSRGNGQYLRVGRYEKSDNCSTRGRYEIEGEKEKTIEQYKAHLFLPL